MGPEIMDSNSFVITISGEAGQGLLTIGDLLVKSLVRSGYRIVVSQDYESRVRGGLNAYTVRVGTGEILSPREKIDLLVAMNQGAVETYGDQLSERGLILAGQSFDLSGSQVLSVPYKDLAENRYVNVAALGVTCAVLGLTEDLIREALEKAFGKKHPEAVEANRQALSKAYGWCEGKTPSDLKLPQVTDAPRKLILNGNQAIALGAMAGGAKFCSFYPMTPSTSVALELGARAEEMGLVVEQAEDEIAAVNMAIGASVAGAPSLVTTSGGGFALMAEGISLAGITETPIVVVLVQRPGPATGLPTRTEQADLEFVLHAGHGEFPRAIFTPGTIEECFELSRRSFDLANRFQGPVFLLSDQCLADSFRDVAPFDLENGPRAQPMAAHGEEIETPYQRFALSENGISPRLLPGQSEHLVRITSDEHYPDGRITEEAGIRVSQNKKRLSKLDGLKKEVIPPEWIGPDRPDLLLVSWGSSRGAVVEAAKDLQSEDRDVAVLNFSQVWPLVPEQFLPRLEEAGRVVSVEGNATGQMARLIRRETGFYIEDRVLRFDGRPLTPEYITGQIENGETDSW